jgi:large subunit ribosomal protein L4
MKVKVYKTDGTESGNEVELSDEIFAIEPNDTVIYEDVKAFLAHQRQGTAKTKGRSEIRGGGKKAYRQKGTGNARRGTIRSPLLRGGGTVFGPKPRTYSIRLTKKMKQLARKSALTYKARENAVMVVENFKFDEPKTSKLAEIFKNLKLDGKKVLFLLPNNDVIIYKSGRNIPKVHILEANKPSTYEITNADVLLMTQDSVDVLTSNLNKTEEQGVAA